MKKLIRKMEELMVAVTFAEAGEYDEANRQAGRPLDNAFEEERATAEGRTTNRCTNGAQ
jgi:hypothetical protein